jgi:hypothetical protein
MLQGLLGTSVGREAEVDRHRGRVGDDVARHTAADPDRRQPLPIGAPVDVHAAGLIGRQPVQDRAELVNCVVAEPGSRGVRAGAFGADHHTNRALAAGLDESAGRLAEDRDVGAQPVRHFPLDAAQTVCGGIDFLAVVHHQRDVVSGVVDRCGQMQEHRVAGFHVRRAAAVQLSVGQSAGQIVDGRDGVGVARQQDPRRPAVIRAGQHRVAVADDLEPACLFTQRGLDLVGDALLVSRLAGDVHQRRGQRDRIAA